MIKSKCSLFVFLSTLISSVICELDFEVKIDSFSNDKGRTASNSSCRGEGNSYRAECDTFFQICVKQFQSTPTFDECLVGNVTTSVLGGNSFELNQEPYKFHFKPAWIGGFSIIVRALNKRVPAELIYETSLKGQVGVGDEWSRKTLQDGSEKRLIVSYRVHCSQNFYGSGCTVKCVPKNGKFGHYTCDENGKMVCLPGWTNSGTKKFCETPVCQDGCNNQHGKCVAPNQCRCDVGWTGPRCDQCKIFPGCKNGKCDDGQPFTCECNIGWGGVLCNLDLNYCTNNQPCQNGGTCTNTGEGSYTCDCPPGFSGSTCERKVVDCDLHQPCLNGGTCLKNEKGESICKCKPGFRGQRCESNATSCNQKPCNGGKCLEDANGYKCICLAGQTGVNCEIGINECASNPCENGGKCKDHDSHFECVCPPGYTGDKCETDIDDCQYNNCMNGGTCIDKRNNYQCVCPAGYFGRLCENKVDCRKTSCRNGGTCQLDAIGYRCQCKKGFTGNECEWQVNLCADRPCINGGTCRVDGTSFKCMCLSNYHGDRCEYEISAAKTESLSVGSITEDPIPPTKSGQVTSPVKDSEDSLTTSQVLLIVCLGVLIPLAFILAAVIIFLYCTKWRKRNHSKESQENYFNDAIVCNKEMNNKLADSNVINSLTNCKIMNETGGYCKKKIEKENLEEDLEVIENQSASSAHKSRLTKSELSQLNMKENNQYKSEKSFIKPNILTSSIGHYSSPTSSSLNSQQTDVSTLDADDLKSKSKSTLILTNSRPYLATEV